MISYLGTFNFATKSSILFQRALKRPNIYANRTTKMGLECGRCPLYIKVFKLLVSSLVFQFSSSVMGFTVILLHYERWVVLRRTFLLGAIMYGLRAIVLGVTFIPPSLHNRDEICRPQLNGTHHMYMSEIATRFVAYVVTLGLNSGQDKILCGDLMFSGHTVVLTIMYFVQLQYTPRKLVYIRYIAAPITFCGIGALVLSGGHYTMDVLIAYWLTSHVFWGYHQMFEMPKEDRPQAPMSRLWWFWLAYWFESDVPNGKLENKWDWPFQKPQIMHDFMAKINRNLQ
ncbi:hypothetical protein WR25_10257 isoform E [Diploscapter pachys]|uniref:Sphingomyelin synthase-like domain-containing protein n=1 Tax=Diploscapter pachys TaxID=2018661 RepID=A0A2A2LFF7_9BILA|nr:hypothetical protein WR25_10257 isoform D [Diploscapter pachys]PAV84992.1 hypothetical protein WR25_10257 isoform E [Diploscapter pachys]